MQATMRRLANHGIAAMPFRVCYASDHASTCEPEYCQLCRLECVMQATMRRLANRSIAAMPLRVCYGEIIKNFYKNIFKPSKMSNGVTAIV